MPFQIFKWSINEEINPYKVLFALIRCPWLMRSNTMRCSLSVWEHEIEQATGSITDLVRHIILSFLLGYVNNVVGPGCARQTFFPLSHGIPAHAANQE